MTFRWGGDPKEKKPTDAGFNLLVAHVAAAEGQYFKGWLLGSVADSNNDGVGFCGFGDVNGSLKAPFRSQLQMHFYAASGKKLAGCYCNLCPVHDGDEVTCATDQWHLETTVSDDGACRAPKDSAAVTVTIEGVAKPANAKQGLPAGKGTTVARRFRFARCEHDGSCAKQQPAWFTH